MNKKFLIGATILTAISILAYLLYFSKPSPDHFLATGNDYQSQKKIEDYFVDTLRMKPDEAKKFADIGVSFYVSKNTTLDGIIGNLAYYGLVRDENTLRYALEHTKDASPGNDQSIRVGAHGTIDLAYYELSRTMDTWQIADALLNNPHPIGIEYNYLFMPGDPNSRYGPRPQE